MPTVALRDMKAVNGDTRMPRLVFVPLFLLALAAVPTPAQSGNDVTEQMWLDVNPAYFINPDLKFFGDIGTRWEVGDNGWWRLVIRPSFRTKLAGRFYFTFGIGNFLTFNEVIDNRWELRPFQGLDFNWPRGRFALRHYFRLEERYDYNAATWEVRTSLRGRYRLSAAYQFGARRTDRFWQVGVSGEIFATFTGQQGQMREQSRVTLGLDRSLRRDIHFRFELTWQEEGALSDEGDGVTNLYFRFRLTKKWGHARSLREESSS